MLFSFRQTLQNNVVSSKSNLPVLIAETRLLTEIAVAVNAPAIVEEDAAQPHRELCGVVRLAFITQRPHD